jgi:hypothetical protein
MTHIKAGTAVGAMPTQLGHPGHGASPPATGYVRWVIDGHVLTFKEFCDTIWPEPCADKTAWLLRFSK